MPATRKNKLTSRKPTRTARAAQPAGNARMDRIELTTGREWDSFGAAPLDHNGVDNELNIDLTLQDDEALSRRSRR